MALDPVDEGLGSPQREVELVAVVGDECEAEERTADAVIFGVEGGSDVQCEAPAEASTLVL